ncbi:MAG TPA: HlyD family efflux transporter periplasmic adaptor subunit [Polyangiaceae bacterium]|nr:HlyD family efflux transporter periplasmic adaptor subunit [Polyangiaceae bacterium]
MSAGFSRSLKAIRASDHRRSLVGVGVGALLLAAWAAWLFLARVARYEVSASARLEVGRTPHRVAAPVSGQVAAVRFALADAVEAGDVLLELDARPLRLQLEEKRARLAASEAQARPLGREVDEHRRALREAEQAGRARNDEALARQREAEATARLSEVEAERAAQLQRAGLASEAEAVRADAEARARRAGTQAQQLGATRADAEQRSQLGVLAATLAGLERQAAALEGERSALRAEIATIEGEIERRVVRAPVAGRLGEIAVLREGAFLSEGDAIATVVPPGELRVVAEFPVASVGRLAPGQSAQVRLDAFPWTEFGSAPAEVSSVGTEAQSGRVRVELAVRPEPGSPIPMQHGLPGEVVVEVERVTPATLLLRAAGQLVRPPAGRPSPSGGGR